MKFCQDAFYNLEIHEDGSVYNCCAHFNNYMPLENIFEEPFEKIWNSSRAIEIRKNLLKGNFSLCNPMCNKYNGEAQINDDCKEYMEQYPLYIYL